jgi:hypothetical protein
MRLTVVKKQDHSTVSSTSENQKIVLGGRLSTTLFAATLCGGGALSIGFLSKAIQSNTALILSASIVFFIAGFFLNKKTVIGISSTEITTSWLGNPASYNIADVTGTSIETYGHIGSPRYALKLTPKRTLRKHKNRGQFTNYLTDDRVKQLTFLICS